MCHVPFVHEGILGERPHSTIESFNVHRDNGCLLFDPIKIWQPNPDSSGSGTHVTYIYRVERPLFTHFTKAMDQKSFRILFAVTPTKEGNCLGWMIIALDYDPDISDADVREFQNRIISQDIPIVESQWPKCLSFDFSEEISLESDRASIAYRKWLKDLGVKYGCK